MNPKANPLPGEQGAQQTTGEASRFIIPDDPARFISRSSAGDCCVLCGKVRVPLPVEHGCAPDVDPAGLVNALTNSCPWHEAAP
jgi:hypothetical protein